MMARDCPENEDQTTATVTLIQMDCAYGQPAENFNRISKLLVEARRLGSDLVVLPELWSTAYDLEHAADHAASLTGQTRSKSWFGRFASLARANCVWLTGSMLESQADGRIYNCMPVYNPRGRLVAAYRKIHLFRLMLEDRYLAAGQDTTLFDMPWGRTGLAICYDLRFPELFRRYAVNDAKLIIIPAEWPCTRSEHWSTLLRARAIENQCFVAACNRVGESEGAKFCGRSAVINPWGETLIEGSEKEELLTVTIDLTQCDAARDQIPVIDDRRPELY